MARQMTENRRPSQEAQQSMIAEAILSLLRTGGHAALTTDAVAATAGVSKATIYKMWPNKSQLLIHAASTWLVIFDVPDRGSFREEVRELLHYRAEQYNSEHGGHLFAALVGATAQDPDFRAVFKDWVREQMGANANIIQRGIERGELRKDFDPNAIGTLIAAPLIYRMVVEGDLVDDALIDAVVESLTFAITINQ